MNIILLNPPYFFKVVREGRCQHEAAIWDSVYPPLSLATIASFLRDQHNVLIIDAIAEEKDLPSILEAIDEFQADLIISSISTPTVVEDLRVLKEIKANSRAKIAVFGAVLCGRVRNVDFGRISGTGDLFVRPGDFAHQRICAP